MRLRQCRRRGKVDKDEGRNANCREGKRIEKGSVDRSDARKRFNFSDDIAYLEWTNQKNEEE